ncbi:MAG: PAS domain-containing protein [Gemmatimonadaceae bacterium]|nr:PAS domain-containing protein [Gemmatimonadaceae bacterium]MCC6431915.1 PAS domain-containing protein [Gemmatimonadaceae bacterium]
MSRLARQPSEQQPPSASPIRPWWIDAALLAVAIVSAELLLHHVVDLLGASLPVSVRAFANALGMCILIGPLFGWMMYRQRVDAKLALAAAGSRSRRVPGSPHRRVRVAVMGSLAVIAAMVVGPMWGLLATSTRAAGDAAMLDLATQQHALVQRVARYAVSASIDSTRTDSLAATVVRLNQTARALALQVDSLTDSDLEDARAAQTAVHALAGPREALLLAANGLTATSLDDPRRRAALDDVQHAVDRVTPISSTISTRLQSFSAQRLRRSMRGAMTVAAFLLLVIALIAVLVIEPVVRLLDRQHQAITAQSRRLDLIVQSADLGTWEWNIESGHVLFNAPWLAMLGYAEGELPPHIDTWRSMSHPDDLVMVKAVMTAHLKGQTPEYRCEQRLKHRDGSWRWVMASGRVIERDTNGRARRAVGVHLDVTAQKHADEELQRTSDLLEEAQAVSRMGSWTIDMQTGEFQCSREVYRLFGHDESMAGHSQAQLLDAFLPKDRQRLLAAAARLRDDGTPYSLVLETRAARSTARYMRSEGRVRVDRDGRVVGLIGTVMDVTAEIGREEALREAQLRAEAASHSKSEFLANMSHEIRTPLTAILGYTEVLREDALATRAPLERVHSIETIRRAGEHLLTVINDILDISKIEAGRMLIEHVPTPLPRVLFDVDSLMRSRAAAKGVTLTTSLVTPIPDQILCDPTRLRQILVNLVGNATKFTDAGRIDIRVRACDAEDGPRLLVAVEDTGPGMSAEQGAQLFQPFMQADSSVTRRHGGTGLGLAICRRLAHLMHGDVTLVRSAPDEGSVFELSLPLATAPQAVLVHDLQACFEQVVTTERPASGEIRLPGRVLLVEDGEDNQRLISYHLRSAGADVVVAENGVRALQAVDRANDNERPFDLIVSDMQMPEMDGYTLAATLRARGDRTPIVALTAHAMAHDRQKCLDAGCDDYASKPIEKAALLAACARWMHLATSENIFPVSDDVLHSDLQDDPDLGALVAGFVDALGARLETLNDRLAAGDLEEVARRVHQLKGAAGGYGFPTISEAARVVEQAVQLGREPTAIAHALALLEARCLAARRAQRQSLITGREPATP